MWSQIRLLQKLIIVLIVFLIVPVLVVGISLFSITLPLAQRETRDMLGKVVDQLHENVQYRVTGYQNMLMQMAVDPRLSASLTQTYSELQDEVLALQQINASISRVRSYFPIKTIRFYKSNPTLREDGGAVFDMERAERLPWTAAMSESRQPFYWYFDADNPQPAFHIGKWLVDYMSNDDYGIIDYEVTTQALFENLANPLEFEDSWIVIADQNGKALIDYRGLKIGDSIADLTYLNDSYSSKSGSYTERIDGKNHLIVYQTTSLGWKIITIVSQEALWERLQLVRQAAIAASILFVVLTLVVLISFGKRITNRLNVLIRSMRKVREGTLGLTVRINGKDELGDVEETFNQMSRQLETSMLENAAARSAAETEKLRLLQAQINPHFLYNTLALVKSMAMDVGSAEISGTVDALAKFFRLALNQGRDVLLLREELEHIQAYLDIHEWRYPGKVTVRYVIDEATLLCEIVKITLQPIVENALMHAFTHRGGRGAITISAKLAERFLFIRIEDDGKGMNEAQLQDLMNPPMQESGGGFGLYNVRERLTRFYGAGFEMTVASVPEQGTVVSLRIPQPNIQPEGATT
ncbi:two-component sensor histidine kinase [Paenibacillus agaridevorans]|uniref:histidine kinase n=1 Tax=Paenibacillus agaridevorans TaxID=171404 RepID=A0A2R5F1Y8_9BACL|nr:histidine kinase [Paenibacillus agaridevorans]GBG09801.1 two-component sensor histidine kinase [Paenibacillus agaridevorans]